MNNIFKPCMRLRYYIQHPFYTLKALIRTVKFAYQRCVYGYCKSDVWDIDDWFLNVIPIMIRDLAQEHCGYPADLKNDSEWVTILMTMAQHFDNASGMSERAERKFDYSNFHMKEYEDFENWREEELKKGFEMFEKYFRGLWD